MKIKKIARFVSQIRLFSLDFIKSIKNNDDEIKIVTTWFNAVSEHEFIAYITLLDSKGTEYGYYINSRSLIITLS